MTHPSTAPDPDGVGGRVRNSLGLEPPASGAPHIPPPKESAGEVAGVGREVRAFTVDRVGLYDGGPEPVVQANKGMSKYPFAELEVGHALRVTGRDISTVRSALKRWVAMDRVRRALKFQVWRARSQGERVVMVKRTK